MSQWDSNPQSPACKAGTPSHCGWEQYITSPKTQYEVCTCVYTAGDRPPGGLQASPSPAFSNLALPHSVTDGGEDSTSLGSAGTPSHPHK